MVGEETRGLPPGEPLQLAAFERFDPTQLPRAFGIDAGGDFIPAQTPALLQHSCDLRCHHGRALPAEVALDRLPELLGKIADNSRYCRYSPVWTISAMSRPTWRTHFCIKVSVAPPKMPKPERRSSAKLASCVPSPFSTSPAVPTLAAPAPQPTQ